MVEVRARLEASLKVAVQEKAWNVGVRELLLLIEAFNRALVSSLLTKLTDRGFWQ